jgi:mRNA degradation ribonuclease J1/J2
LHRHAALAKRSGVPEVTILENGDVGVLGAHGLRKDGRVEVGRVHVWAGRALPASVLRERQAIAQGGVAVVVVPVDERGRVAGEVTIETRGVLDTEASPELLADSRQSARAAVGELAGPAPGTPYDEAAIADAARFAVRRALARVLGFKPVTVVQVVRVAG